MRPAIHVRASEDGKSGRDENASGIHSNRIVETPFDEPGVLAGRQRGADPFAMPGCDLCECGSPFIENVRSGILPEPSCVDFDVHSSSSPGVAAVEFGSRHEIALDKYGRWGASDDVLNLNK